MSLLPFEFFFRVSKGAVDGAGADAPGDEVAAHADLVPGAGAHADGAVAALARHAAVLRQEAHQAGAHRPSGLQSASQLGPRRRAARFCSTHKHQY